MRSLLALLMLTLPCAAELAPERAKALEHMVIQDCGSCHGLTLKGGLGRPLTTEALVHAEPEGLALIILDGVPGTAMPPWRPLLTEAEAMWIAHYLKKTKPVEKAEPVEKTKPVEKAEPVEKD